MSLIIFFIVIMALVITAMFAPKGYQRGKKWRSYKEKP